VYLPLQGLSFIPPSAFYSAKHAYLAKDYIRVNFAKVGCKLCVPMYIHVYVCVCACKCVCLCVSVSVSAHVFVCLSVCEWVSVHNKTHFSLMKPYKQGWKSCGTGLKNLAARHSGVATTKLLIIYIITIECIYILYKPWTINLHFPIELNYHEKTFFKLLNYHGEITIYFNYQLMMLRSFLINFWWIASSYTQLPIQKHFNISVISLDNIYI